MDNLIRHSLSIFLVFLLFTTDSGSAEDNQEVNQKRNQLIGYILDKELPIVHYSHKKMDEALSMAAFGLYLKQIDYQKRFLLSSDVKTLRSFGPHIADNLEHGTNALPETGFEIMKEQIAHVEKLVDQIIAAGFDANSDDVDETDPEIITYAVDLKALKDRWRKIIKAQVMRSYLDLAEDQKLVKEKPPDNELWKQAKERVIRVTKDFFSRLHQETLQDHYDHYFNAVAMAFDPHTNYFPPEQKEEFDIEMRGNLEGIGGILREENGFIKVINIIPGSPSAKQGLLQVGDIILKVAENSADPVDITDMRLGDAVRLLRGPKGTVVHLTVKKPDGKIDVISITRNVVQIEATFVKETVIDAPDGGKIGYILIPGFYRDFEKSKGRSDARNATDDTRKALQDLNKTKLKGIILDLRNNGGGSLVDAVNISGLFIKSGPIVQVKDNEGKVKVLNDDDASIEYSGPLVVLVNQFSASASEIVAAALQDYKRAVIVGGEHTHGKGTVQAVLNLNKNIRSSYSKEISDVGQLNVTVQKFYRITGGSTQLKGVVPDIILPSLFQHLKSGEKYLDYSLPWDQISMVKYSSFRGQPIDIDMVRKKSLQRVKHDPGLGAITDEAAKADKRSKQTLFSLKLADMRRNFDETREERKIFNSQFINHKIGQHNDDQSEIDREGINNEGSNWKELIKKDPYIGEAKNIIADMER